MQAITIYVQIIQSEPIMLQLIITRWCMQHNNYKGQNQVKLWTHKNTPNITGDMI